MSISFLNIVPPGNVTPFEVNRLTVQSTNSDITQTLNRHAHCVRLKCKRMCDRTWASNNYELPGGQIQHGSARGMPEIFFLDYVLVAWIRHVIRYNHCRQDKRFLILPK